MTMMLPMRVDEHRGTLLQHRNGRVRPLAVALADEAALADLPRQVVRNTLFA